MSDFFSRFMQQVQSQPVAPPPLLQQSSIGTAMNNLQQRPAQPAQNPWVNANGGMSSPFDPKPPGITPPQPGLLTPSAQPPAQAAQPPQQQQQGGQGGKGGGSISGTIGGIKKILPFL